MNNAYNEKTHTLIKQLLNKFSTKAPGFAYIASFDSGVTYKGAVGLASIEKNSPINTKIFLILLQFLSNSQHFLYYS